MYLKLSMFILFVFGNYRAVSRILLRGGRHMIGTQLSLPVLKEERVLKDYLQECLPSDGHRVWITNPRGQKRYCLEIGASSMCYVERRSDLTLKVRWPEDRDRYGMFCQKFRAVLDDVARNGAEIFSKQMKGVS